MLARKHWFTLASAAISIVTIFLLYRWVKGQSGEIKLPTDAKSLGYIAVGIVVYLSAFILRGLRWRLLLTEVGVRPPLSDSTGLLTVGYAANTLLPARAGDAVRVFLMAQRTGAGPSLMVSTLIAERLLDVLALGSAFVVTSLIYAGGLPTGGKAIFAGVLLAVAVLGCVVAYWIVKSDRLPDSVRGIIRDASLAVRQLRGSKHLFQALGFTFAAWTIEASVYLIAGHAVGITLNIGQAAYVLSTAAMFTLIPSGPGFAGTMDSAMIYSLRNLHEAKSTVVPYIFTLRFIVFIPITILGGVLLVARYGGFAALKAARAAQSDENKQASDDAKAGRPLDLPTGEMAALQADALPAEPAPRS